MIAMTILASAPAMLVFACQGDGVPEGAKRFDIQFREPQAKDTSDVSLDDLSLSDPEHRLGFLTPSDFAKGIQGRITPTGSIEIFPKPRKEGVTSWLRLNQIAQTDEFAMNARYGAIVFDFGLEESVSGTCTRSVLKGTVQ